MLFASYTLKMMQDKNKPAGKMIMRANKVGFKTETLIETKMLIFYKQGES